MHGTWSGCNTELPNFTEEVVLFTIEIIVFRGPFEGSTDIFSKRLSDILNSSLDREFSEILGCLKKEKEVRVIRLVCVGLRHAWSSEAFRSVFARLGIGEWRKGASKQANRI